jgi:hypothetical protein
MWVGVLKFKQANPEQRLGSAWQSVMQSVARTAQAARCKFTKKQEP